MIYLNLQYRVHKIKMKFLLNILTFSSCIFYSSIYGQFEYLESYIPYEKTPKETHPILEIKTWVHIMQYSKSDPKNITKDSLHYLKTQFNWINQMFSQLKQPTVANANGEKPYVKDARIRFIMDTISFHIDENGWDRMKMQKVSNSNRWIDIIKIDADSNSITLDGVRDRFKPILDSLIIDGTLLNNGVYYPLKAVRSGYNTIIYLKESINVSEDSTGHVSYFQKIDKNCHRDNWINFTNEDKNYLHIFYTGASKDAPAFGCGPSPYFLNVSNILMNGGYATAQLTGHELGHCVGLRHTNTPQFNDLPRTDKFGWLKCDDKNVSNNIMGYNLCRNYLSPLQIGYIHYKYSNVAELAQTTKNIEHKTKKIKIKKNTSWEKSIISTGDIIVKRNSALTIKGKLIMPKGARIILEKRSKLIVDGGLISSIKDKWGGIIYCRTYPNIHKKPLFKKNKAQLIEENNGEILY